MVLSEQAGRSAEEAEFSRLKEGKLPMKPCVFVLGFEKNSCVGFKWLCKWLLKAGVCVGGSCCGCCWWWFSTVGVVSG